MHAHFYPGAPDSGLNVAFVTLLGFQEAMLFALGLLLVIGPVSAI